MSRDWGANVIRAVFTVHKAQSRAYLYFAAMVASAAGFDYKKIGIIRITIASQATASQENMHLKAS